MNKRSRLQGRRRPEGRANRISLAIKELREYLVGQIEDQSSVIMEQMRRTSGESSPLLLNAMLHLEKAARALTRLEMNQGKFDYVIQYLVVARRELTGLISQVEKSGEKEIPRQIAELTQKRRVRLEKIERWIEIFSGN